MTDKEFVDSIGQMSETELLAVVIENPEYLCDSYYRSFGSAIVCRHRGLSQPTEPTHAQMYAWLREQHWSNSPLAVVLEPKKAIKLGYSAPFGDLLDSTIRELMRKRA